ncbi:RNHCP domain-containing protein [Candidatus Gracilibacteria bacterium]|nr:RNHCP domain-containing protein [Candidatus Gracilibacteria bacterium]
MGFIMIDESFKCQNCKNIVPNHPSGSARNHCPKCLYSLHLDDNFPGDRLSNCKSLMLPIGIDHKKNKGWMIKHKCTKCNKEILNKVSPDDNYLDFVKKINSNF